ncbi:MAG: hypothetical protein APF76_11645 [Desulfitibacter sp. BRH_c19]|nr:MAG: hypothetical protein APF76_11645 [Desulfitibacter sp. BRH_c19]
MDNVRKAHVHIFAEASTADGFISYIDSVLSGLRKIYILTGGTHKLKSDYLIETADFLNNKGIPIEFIMCGIDHEKVDGIIIPPIRTAIIDGSYPHKYEARYPGVVEETINLEECWDKDVLDKDREEIVDLTNKVMNTMEKGTRYLKTAREIHNHWEQLYVVGLRHDAANKKAHKVINEIFKDVGPKIRHLFASSINFKGSVNFINEITANCTKRYILKGQPGTGKATLIEKVVEEATSNNFNIDIYHCALDPSKFDMVVIPQLKVSVIHGTPPHWIEPTRIGDVVVDMLECIDEEVVVNSAKEAERLEEEFELTQEQAVRTFKEAKAFYDKLDKIYLSATVHKKLHVILGNLKQNLKEEIEKHNNNNSL